MVVKVSDQIATIFSTSTNEEFSVFMRDLADDAEAATRVDRIGEYTLHDLAMLDDGNVGVLTRVEKDVAFVLTNVGTLERPNVKACKLADFKRKMNSRNQTAQDGAMELIDVGSIVRINEGQLKDVNATVEHIYKGTIWVKARASNETAGLSVCDLVSASSTGGQGTRQGSAIPGLTPAMQWRLPTHRIARPRAHRAIHGAHCPNGRHREWRHVPTASSATTTTCYSTTQGQRTRGSYGW